VNVSGKGIIPILLVAVVLTSCKRSITIPATAIIKTAAVETQIAVVTATITLTATQLPLPSITPSLTSKQIVYYYFVMVPENTIPEKSIVIVPDLYVLAPAGSNIAHSQDPATDLRIALKTMLSDKRNLWISSDIELINVSFHDGQANVILQGKYFGVGDVTLIAARMQMLLTVFANDSVQTAVITLNGDTIENLGVSNSMNAKPIDYIFTRADVESFINENSYVTP
jgi:hypothetical protein